MVWNCRKINLCQDDIAKKQSKDKYDLDLHNSILVNEGMNKSRLDVGNLANGMYYIKLQNGATVQMARIIIQK